MLPTAFLERMKNMLDEDYPAFLHSLMDESAVRGARINRIKADEGAVPSFAQGRRRIPYAKLAYYVDGDERVGMTPEHHAGIVYMQDPGAMCAIEAVDISDDLWVADLCAAPGGKSTQIAEMLGDGGFLLSNEYVPKRAKIIVGNMERLGVRNAIVTSMDTKELGDLYPECFDLVVCDAPCSGEGMFRKNGEAQDEWSHEAVLSCAQRQLEILENAYRMLKPSGRLLYSTCTWSTEENECVVTEFLHKHADMHLIPVTEKIEAATADGIVIKGGEELGLTLTRRVYPHITEGEGQYIALMAKDGEAPKRSTFVYKENTKALTRDEMRVVDDFFAKTLVKKPFGRLIKNGDMVVLISHGCPIPPHSVFMSGVVVGELRRGVLHPHHQFFSAYGCDFRLTEELTPEACEKYLRGEEISSSLTDSGFIALTYMGATLGGGKLSGGRIKNHYPKGLRNH